MTDSSGVFEKLLETDINWGFRAHDMGRLPAAELADRISGRGFGNIQLALNKAVAGLTAEYGTLSPGLGQMIGREFHKRDIDIAVLGCYINPVHPDISVREIHIKRFIEHLKYCRDFGCSVVGTETGSPAVPGSERNIYEEITFTEFMRSLETLVAAAEKIGVIVGIEGVADKDTIHSHERMKQVLDLIASPNLGIIYDPVNFLPFERAADSDILMEEAFSLFADRMVAIHAKDYVLESGRVNTAIPSGRGELNYPLLLKLVRRYKPMIPVLLENNSPATINETITFINTLRGNR